MGVISHRRHGDGDGGGDTSGDDGTGNSDDSDDGGLAASDDTKEDDDDDVFEVAKPARRVTARQGASSSDGRGIDGNVSGSNTGLGDAEVVVLE